MFRLQFMLESRYPRHRLSNLSDQQCDVTPHRLTNPMITSEAP